MESIESNLSSWGALIMAVTGLFWILPGLNFLAAIGGIACLVLVIARLGFGRAFLLASCGLAVTLGIGLWLSAQTSDITYAISNPILYSAVTIFPAFALGKSARNLETPSRTIFKGMIPLILLLIALGIYFNFMTDFRNLIGQMETLIIAELQKNPQLMEALSNSQGSEGNSAEMISGLSNMILLFFKLMPGILLTGFLGLVVMGYWLAGMVAQRLQIAFIPLRPFYLWRADDLWLLPTVAGLALIVFFKDNLYFYIGANLLIVVGHVYAVTGLSLIEAWMRRFSTPIALRIIFYVIILISNFVGMAFIACLGLLDSRFNFRRDYFGEEENNLE